MKWEIRSLGSLCSIQLGKTPARKSSRFWDQEKSSDNVWLSISDLIHGREVRDSAEYISNEAMDLMKVVPKGTLMVSFKLTLGRTSIAARDLFTNEAIAAILNLDERLSQRFLMHFFERFDWKKACEGDEKLKGYTFNKAKLNSLKIPIPPLEEQQRIVELLDEAFEAIDKAKANIERNLANARELFQSRLNDIFSNPSSDWDVKPLGEVCSIKHGYAFKSTYFATSGDFILLTPGNFHEEGGYRDRKGKTKYFTGEIPKEFILKKGDFLVAMTEQAVGLLGSSIVVPNSDVFLHNQRLGKVEVFEGVEWVNGFFAHQFNVRTFRSAVQQTASGTKVRHTSPKKLCAIHITIPEAQIQSQISVELDALKKQCQNLENEYQAELSSLEELRQSILEQAFEGKLTEPVAA